VDEVVHPTVLDLAARRWAAKPKRPLDRPLALGLSMRTALDLAEQTPLGRRLIYRQARQSVLQRTGGHHPAPLKALEAVEIGYEHGMVAGLEAEARAFGELAVTETARNLIWLFLATQRRKRDAGAAIERIGVVGAGFMGAAIAEVGAASGLSVRVRDVTPQAVAKGLATARKLVDEGVTRRRFEPREARAILQRLSGTSDYSGFDRTPLVIEAVFEDLQVKRRVLQELESVVRPDAVIASNTSALPIHQIASQAIRPERIVGMHFFSPAQRMPLLEVVRPAAAADWAVERAAAVGTKMGKTVIVVGDSPGFYTSRVLGVMLNEAVLILKEGARMEAVDRAMTAFGFPVGPFVLYDDVGLEVAQHAGETVSAAFGDRIPPATIVGDLVAAGDTGRKSGRGFYLWPQPSRTPRALQGLVRTPGRRPNPRALGETPRRSFAQTEIQERLALLFVNEAIRCLDEGVLLSASDGDVGAVLGLGFPPFRGGPFHHADAIGAGPLVDTLRRLAEAHGRRYEPADSLVTHSRTGESYTQ
jgi:3-hydroxyacyl-CoA dehydrogenase/enoyl-CoA hydratase/3-hydroxybutyryl-CoA epimerase